MEIVKFNDGKFAIRKDRSKPGDKYYDDYEFYAHEARCWIKKNHDNYLYGMDESKANVILKLLQDLGNVVENKKG